MADLIGLEHINWDTFEVTDPEAPEAAAPAEPTPEEPEAAPAEEVAASEAPTPTPEEEEAAPEPEQAPLYAGRYQSAEELEQAYLHQQQLASRQANELGELRRLRAEMDELRQSQQQQRPGISPSELEELIEADPAQATELAWLSGDERAQQRAIAAWDELSPGAPRVWAENKHLQHRLGQMEQYLSSLGERDAHSERQQVMAEAYRQFNAAHPDAEQLEPVLAQVAAELASETGVSVVHSLLAAGTPEAARRTLELLYHEARTRAAGQGREASLDRARQHVADTLRAKQEAAVAPAGRAAEPEPEKSYDDVLLEELRAEDSARDGFHVGHY